MDLVQEVASAFQGWDRSALKDASVNSFPGRVRFAAYGIAQRLDSRRFDTCFEMYDGDAVAVALVRIARRSEVFRGYLEAWAGGTFPATMQAAAEKWEHVPDHALPKLAERIRADAKVERDAMWARMAEEQAERNRRHAEEQAAYAVELTPAGEQLVIPGTERKPTPKQAQLNLWS